MDLIFGEAGMNDVETVVEFSRRLFEEHPGVRLVEERESSLEQPRDFEPERVRRALHGLIADSALGRVWLIKEAGQAIGYLALAFSYSLEYGGRCAFVDELFVEPDQRGRGVGSTALRFAGETAARLGAATLLLEVERENVRAYQLYRRHGFEDYSRHLLVKPLDHI